MHQNVLKTIALVCLTGGLFLVVHAAPVPPSSGHYIVLTEGDYNADSLYANTLSGDAKTAVTGDPDYGKGWFGSSMTADSKVNRWTEYEDGVAKTVHPADAFPPNANYDYWIGSISLTTPNDASVDAHFGANHVYAFSGRSLTIAGGGIITHCSKGSSICDFGENVTFASGSYQFPALGTGRPCVRGKARVTATSRTRLTANSFAFVPGGGMPEGKRTACYLGWALTGDKTAVVHMQNDGKRSTDWYWCGDCSDYFGTIILNETTATESCNARFAVSNVVMNGTVEVGKYEVLTILGAEAFVSNAIVRAGGELEVPPASAVPGGTCVANLQMDGGSIVFTAESDGVLAVDGIQKGGAPVRIVLPGYGLKRALLTVPASSGLSASDFAAFGPDGEQHGCARFYFVGNGAVRTLWVDDATVTAEMPGRTVDLGDGDSFDALIPNSRVRVNVGAGSTLGLAQSEARMQVVGQGGTINIRSKLREWEAIPLLWLDASASDSIADVVITYEKSYYNYNDGRTTLKIGETFRDEDGNPYIKGWFDRRPSQQTVKLWNSRYDNPFDYRDIAGGHAVMFGTNPRRVLGGLNGVDYIAFDRPSKKATVIYCDGESETVTADPSNRTRIYFTAGDTDVTKENDSPLKPRYAFMVFGSQQGGGGSLLAQNANFLRAGTVNAHTKDDPILAANPKGAEFWIDGVQVDPTATGFSGGWQVIAVDFKNTDNIFYGLGYGSTEGTDAGGQNYAEIILVDKELSTEQRQSIEIYLAEKWGLEKQYAYPSWAMKRGATVYGTGTVNLEANAMLSGSFSGTINLNGKTLTIEGALPPGENDFTKAGCVCWYDPDAAGMTKEENCAFSAKTKDGTSVSLHKDPYLRMTSLWNRMKDSFAVGDLMICGQKQRAPWLNAAERGLGSVRKWMDFSNVTLPSSEYDSSSYSIGNVLRFSKITDATTGGNDGSAQQQPMGTIMMVQDSVRGGGHPFADGTNVNSPTLYKSRTGDKAKPGQPIYPSGSDAVLTSGATYLDGERVEGTTATFKGRPEILTVVPTDTFNVIAIGQLGNSERNAGGDSTAEIIGEVLMWDRALSDADRKVAEAYLSWKWLGTLSEGYSALTGATVEGAGRVVANSMDVLPKFSAGSTATVEVPVAGLTFHGQDRQIADPIDLGGASLALPAEVTVTIDAAKLAGGDHVLISCGGGLSTTAFTLSSDHVGRASASLVRTDTSLVLRIAPPGLLLTIW